MAVTGSQQLRWIRSIRCHYVYEAWLASCYVCPGVDSTKGIQKWPPSPTKLCLGCAVRGGEQGIKPGERHLHGSPPMGGSHAGRAGSAPPGVNNNGAVFRTVCPLNPLHSREIPPGEPFRRIACGVSSLRLPIHTPQGPASRPAPSPWASMGLVDGRLIDAVDGLG